MRVLHDPPQLTCLVVGELPGASKHHIVVGLRAALQDELRLSGRFVVDGAEIVAGKRDNKLSLPHDTLNFRSPPIHWQEYSKGKPGWGPGFAQSRAWTEDQA